MPDFLDTRALWALAALPALILLSWLAYRRRQALIGGFYEKQFASKLAKPLPGWRHVLKGFAVVLMAGALIIACARPSAETTQAEFPRGIEDVVAVVDVSRSMATLSYEGKLPLKTDERGTSLDMSRQLIFSRLMPALKGNQLGIVSYAGEPFPQAFLTDDLRALKKVLDKALIISSAPGEGSSLAKALLMAIKLFDADSPNGHERIIVLFSDGGNDDGEEALAQVVQELRQYGAKRKDGTGGIKLVIAGLGSQAPAPIPLTELAKDDEAAKALLHHGKKWYENEEGEIEKTKLDERLLVWLAQKSGGTYKKVSAPEDFDIVSLSHTQSTVKKKGTKELFALPLAIAVGAGLVILLITRERRQLQNVSRWRFWKGGRK